ncbi:MAG: TIGR04255 family protein [Terriglobales bacterium]
MYSKPVTHAAPALRLKNPPLIYVVAQVRFSHVVAIEKYVAEIQEALRHKGFPRFLKGQVHEIAFQADGAPKFNVVDRFEFQDKDSSLGIVLQPNSVAIHTNRYLNYERFEENAQIALMAVHRALNISLSERIGLRYVNLIRLGSGEKWSEYLDQGLLGLDPNSVGVRSWTSRAEFFGATQAGTLAVRCSQSEQPLPPDLSVNTLKLATDLEKGEIVTTLDFDHYVEKISDFKVSSVMAIFGQLHESLDTVFSTAVSPKALTKWGKEEA